MFRSLIAACAACVLISMVSVPSVDAAKKATGSVCAPQAIQAVRNAGQDISKLKQAYNTYFGDEFAQSAMRREWKKMSPEARDVLKSTARNLVVSLANELSPYADATFVWRDDNVAHYRLGSKSGSFKVHMSGKGCMMSDVCIEGSGCLSSYVKKPRTSAGK